MNENRPYPVYPVKPTYPVGVSVLLVNRENQILLGERQDGLKAGGMWSTPGGRIEMNEGMYQTCRREILEETGIDPEARSHFRYLGFREHRRFDEHYFMFYFWADCRVEPVNLEPDKCKGWKWFALDQIPDNCTEPKEILDQLRAILL